MKIALIAVGILVIAGLLAGGQLMGIRNDLAQQREAISGSWSQVDAALQRRAEVIPNLVETVKGYATQEKDVIAAVTSARAALVSARTPQERIQANQQLDSAVGRLLIIVENYPNLKASENFLRLQDELSGTENRIAVERRRYNETVQKYNTTIELFPKNIAARLFSFQRNDAYFRAAPETRTAPQVKF